MPFSAPGQRPFPEHQDREARAAENDHVTGELCAYSPEVFSVGVMGLEESVQATQDRYTYI